MTTKKVTLTLDVTALQLAESAAARDGLSTSAWLSRAARREAVRTGFGVPAPRHEETAGALQEAMADEAELVEAEKEIRAAG